jgi:hypothetical protein
MGNRRIRVYQIQSLLISFKAPFQLKNLHLKGKKKKILKHPYRNTCSHFVFSLAIKIAVFIISLKKPHHYNDISLRFVSLCPT